MVTIDHAFDDDGRAVGLAVYVDGHLVAKIPANSLPYVILKAAEVLRYSAGGKT